MARKTIILGRQLERGIVESKDAAGYTIVTFSGMETSVPYYRSVPDLRIGQKILVHQKPDGHYIEALSANANVIDYPPIRDSLIRAPSDGV